MTILIVDMVIPFLFGKEQVKNVSGKVSIFTLF